MVYRSTFERSNRFPVISKIGLTLLVGIIVSLASVPLIARVASAQFAPVESLRLGIPYGWYVGGTTVEVNVTNTGGTNVTITATSINGVDCPTFSGSNGLELSPGNTTILTITYQDNVFQAGFSYEIKVVTATNNAYSVEGVVNDIPEFPSSLLPLFIIAIATLLTIAIHRRKHSSFLTR